MYHKNHFLAHIHGGRLSVIEIDHDNTSPSISNYNFKLSTFLYRNHISDNLYLFYCCLSGRIYLASRFTIDCVFEKAFNKLPMRFLNELIENRALIPIMEDEYALVIKKYQEFNANDQNNIDHFAFCPTLSCNCSCVYCYEKHIRTERDTASIDHLKGFCKFVEDFVDSAPNRVITCELFGGEPLMKQNRTVIESYFEWLTSKNLFTVITTNGLDFFDYVNLLLAKKNWISLVNVTVDGPENIHNTRRPSKSAQNAFHNIEKVIDILIDAHVPVSISINLDSENIDYLEETIEYILKKGWASFPGKFSFNICKVDDHLDNIGSDAYLSEGQLLYRVLPVLKRTPKHLLNLTRLQFLRVLSSLSYEFGLAPRQSERGRVKFHHCCATSPVNTYYFCPDNSVHRCPYALGITEMAIGTFNAKQTNTNNTLNEWKERAFFRVDMCRRCSIAPICGGGCVIDAYSGQAEKSCAERYESLNIFCREILSTWIREGAINARLELVK